MPSENAVRSIEDLFKNCPSSSPKFGPHISLLSVVSDTPIVALEAILSDLQTTAAEIPLEFQGVTVGNTYFKSVYISIRKSKSLLDLRESLLRLAAARHVEVKMGESSLPSEVWDPHISLFYLDDNQERLSLGHQVRDSGIFASPEGCLASEIWVARCDGRVADWQIEHRLTLSRQN